MPLVWRSSSDPLERPREVALICKTCCRSHHGKALSFHQQQLLRFADPGVQLIAMRGYSCRRLEHPRKLRGGQVDQTGKLENRNGCIEMLVDEVENETKL